MRQRAEEEDLGLKTEYARLKYEAEEKASLKSEEEDKIDEGSRLKLEEHKRARLKV